MTSSVTVVGSLGRDPELRFAQSGIALTNFSIAANRRKKVGDTWEDDVTWFNVVVFGTVAENVAASLAKGDRVIVTGHMQESSWEDKDGNRRTKMELVADSVGAELRFATVEVTRTERRSAESTQRNVPDDGAPF